MYRNSSWHVLVGGQGSSSGGSLAIALHAGMALAYVALATRCYCWGTNASIVDVLLLTPDSPQIAFCTRTQTRYLSRDETHTEKDDADILLDDGRPLKYEPSRGLGQAHSGTTVDG